MWYAVLTGPPQGLPAPEGVTAAQKDRSKRDREGSDMGDGVEICSAIDVADPEPFPARALEAGVVALALGTEGVNPLKAEALAANGETVIVRK